MEADLAEVLGKPMPSRAAPPPPPPPRPPRARRRAAAVERASEPLPGAEGAEGEQEGVHELVEWGDDLILDFGEVEGGGPPPPPGAAATFGLAVPPEGRVAEADMIDRIMNEA